MYTRKVSIFYNVTAVPNGSGTKFIALINYMGEELALGPFDTEEQCVDIVLHGLSKWRVWLRQAATELEENAERS